MGAFYKKKEKASQKALRTIATVLRKAGMEGSVIEGSKFRSILQHTPGAHHDFVKSVIDAGESLDLWEFPKGKQRYRGSVVRIKSMDPVLGPSKAEPPSPSPSPSPPKPVEKALLS